MCALNSLAASCSKYVFFFVSFFIFVSVDLLPFIGVHILNSIKQVCSSFYFISKTAANAPYLRGGGGGEYIKHILVINM